MTDGMWVSAITISIVLLVMAIYYCMGTRREAFGGILCIPLSWLVLILLIAPLWMK